MRDFNHTVGQLVTAYFNGTLLHGDCAHCAVGTIVGGNKWGRFFMTVAGRQLVAGEGEIVCARFLSIGVHKLEEILNHETHRQALKQIELGQKMIDDSGYSKEELMRIEYAFEIADKGNSKDEWMFNGLMAVVSVLADIHGVSLEQAQEAKLLFVKA